MPGWPEFAFWIASIERVRIVLIAELVEVAVAHWVDPSSQGSMRVTCAVAVVSHPDCFGADNYGAWLWPDRDWIADLVATGKVEAGYRIVAGGRHPDGFGTGVDAARLFADFNRRAEDCVGGGVDPGHRG